MAIETLEDIVEEIADAVGVYGAERRSEYVSSMRSRILNAVEVEQRLSDQDLHQQIMRIIKEAIQNEQSNAN